MIFAPLVALSLAAAGMATPYKRASGLVVSVNSNDKSVSSIDDLVLTAKVENTGTEDVKVLKYATILDDKLPTRSFKIKKGDAEVPFTGVRMSVRLADAKENAFTVIPAGKSIEVKHSIANLYDFSQLGAGSFTFDPVTAFQTLSSDDTRNASADDLVSLESQSSPVTVEITKDVARRRLLESRATVSCDDDHADFISSAYSEAKDLAGITASWVSSNGGDELFSSYWGSNSDSDIADRFNAVANENDGDRSLNCNDPQNVCDGNVIAYTLITGSNNIYFCDIFYNEVATENLCSGTTVDARNIRGGTVLHEMTHAVSGTEDVTYGCSADQALSDSDKINNADNYNCFSTQVYANTKC